MILCAIDTLPREATLAVGVFPGREATQLLLVGPGGSLGAVSMSVDAHTMREFRYQRLADQDLIEYSPLAHSAPLAG